jgi:hypothetical protein
MLHHRGEIQERDHPHIEVTLRYAPKGVQLPWVHPVFDDTYRWCDAIGDRAGNRGAGWIRWAGYEHGALEITLWGADLKRLWEVIEPIVDVLPALPGSEVWIRQGYGPLTRNGPGSRRLWAK